MKPVVKKNCRSRPAPRSRRGFTLVEIILVLALVVLVATLLIPGANSMLRAMADDEPDRMFWDTVVAAREQALTGNRVVELRFDGEKRRLQWTDGTTAHQKDFPAGTSVQFLQPRTGSFILLGGQLVETQEVPRLRFYADGTCDALRVQILRPGAPPQTLALDPWTCAPVIGEKK
ncbi:MAG: prepilin-type N-terminal cleavage/methylation domain-containing protein [Opitutae bacterium]|nr:prepilin-type N-terminal cleavage/methylation domain-containing protein [Opitutae bacterium]